MRTACETCRFWSQFAGPRDVTDPIIGECRRYPPVTETSEDEYWSHWPIVIGAAWCGEYQRLSH